MALLVIDRCMDLDLGNIADSAEVDKYVTDVVIAVDAMIKWLYDY